MSLHAVPMYVSEAKEFIANFHRHNRRTAGGLFAVGASDGQRLVGVAIVSRPVAPKTQEEGDTVEVTRCCVLEDAPRGTPSFLYSRCWQAARALGWRRLITYTLQTESGASLRGAGWKVFAELPPNRPEMWQNRPGREWNPVVGQSKFRWEIAA